MNRKAKVKGGGKRIYYRLCQKHCSLPTKYRAGIDDVAKLKAPAYHCFLCGKYSEVCPIGIDGRGVILDMGRAQVEESGGKCQKKECSILLSEKRNYIFRSTRHITGKSVLFPGYNSPSFYPKTTRKLIKVLKDRADMDVLFDYYGEPISELRLEEQEERIIRRVNERLRISGIQEIVMLCPNRCYLLRDRLGIQVLSTYEELSQFGIDRKVEDEGELLLPYPDREEQQWVSWLSPFLQQEPEIIKGTQCCRLGGCAGGKKPDLVRDMACYMTEEGYREVYIYCASYAGNLTRGGCKGVSHLLIEILDLREQSDVVRSMMNRIVTEFW